MANSIALGQARRIVHSELQQARMKSVTSNLVMRVRFNCPAAGQFRMLELLGTPSAPAPQDTAANRCSDTMYPFPPADQNPVTLPNQDGPIRRIDPRVSFGAVQTIEFRPTGTAYSVNPDGTSGPPLAGDGRGHHAHERDRSQIGHGERSWQNPVTGDSPARQARRSSR